MCVGRIGLSALTLMGVVAAAQASQEERMDTDTAMTEDACEAADESAAEPSQ